MKKAGWPDYPFSFHDAEEIGSAMLASIAKYRTAAAGYLTGVRNVAFQFSATGVEGNWATRCQRSLSLR